MEDTKTFYPDREAIKIAEKCQEDDPEWTYKVVAAFGGRSWIEVYDEDGEFVGYI